MAQVDLMDFHWMDLLESLGVDAIDRQNWTGVPLTVHERLLVRMAISWTYGTLKELAETEQPALAEAAE